MARQVPWRLTRRSIPALCLSLLVGAFSGALFFLQLANPDERAIGYALTVGTLFAICAWLAWCAYSWHLELGRNSKGPHLLRYSGLVFGVAMWSAQSFQFFRQLEDGPAWEMHVFRVLFALILPAPFALWGGLLFRYVFDRMFGSRTSRP